ncbi:MAG: tyrosine-protein phosphatase, partial [Acidobacteriota bacterium]
LWLIVAVAVLSTTAASLASANDKPEKAPAKVDGVEVTVENFGKVADFYYRGAQPKDEEYQQLANLGVKTVVDLRDDAKDYAKTQAEKAGLTYINLPMSDKNYPATGAAEKFLSIVNDKANWPLYVHCAGGRHRTGAMTAVFRMDMEGWNVTRAYEEMKDYDFYTRWGHKAMKKFVFDYYQSRMHQRGELQKTQIAASEDQSTNK